jgi:hypothetical protein
MDVIARSAKNHGKHRKLLCVSAICLRTVSFPLASPSPPRLPRGL